MTDSPQPIDLSRRPTPWLDWVGIGLLCVVHYLVVIDASSQASVTIDEFAHLPTGLVNLHDGTFRLYPHNPPLPRVVAAWAARTQSPRLESSLAIARVTRTPGPRYLNLPDYLRLAEVFELENGETSDRYFATFAWGRRAAALWSTLAIPLLFAWGRWWFGRGAGWLACWLWAWCPTVIGHSGLITNDLAAASLGLLAALAFAAWLHAAVPAPHAPHCGRTWRWTLLVGLTLGLALLTKFSAILLVPLFVGWTIARTVQQQGLAAIRRAGFGSLFSKTSRQLLLGLLIALVVLNGGYLFEDTGVPLDAFEFASNTLTRERRPGDPRCEDLDVQAMAPRRINRFKGSLLGMLPCPVPATYLVGFDRLKWEAEGKYDLYLRGQWRRQGYWDYYFYGLLVKWPLSTLAVFLMAMGLLIVDAVRKQPTGLRQAVPWIALAGVPLGMLSLLQDVNLGLRYALPAFPFLFLLAGTLAATSRAVWLRVIAGGAMVLSVVTVARIHPHEMAFFNVAAGGPAQGRLHLIDSNLDWGQDLRRLAAWVKAHPEWSDVRLAYWGPVHPELAGLTPYRIAPRNLQHVPPQMRLPGESPDPQTWGPQPGKYAVSVNFERGMAFRSPLPQEFIQTMPLISPARHGLTMFAVPRNAWSWFEHMRPQVVPEVGYSILLYDVSLEEANRVRTTLGLPVLPSGSTSRGSPVKTDPDLRVGQVFNLSDPGIRASSESVAQVGKPVLRTP